MTDRSFESDSLWSPRVAVEWLDAHIPSGKDWLSWLAHDRRKSQPIVPFTKFAGYNILYKRTDIENIALLIYESGNRGAGYEQ